YGVELVQEHQAGSLLLRRAEQLSDPGRAEAHEHLDELRARHVEERDAGLSRDGPRQQRLPAPRGPEEQDALRDAPAQPLVFPGIPQELDDLLELLDRLV